MWQDRWLGRSEMIHVPVRCAWLATGNNPALSNELARRSIRIRLDAKVDRPWLREHFKHPDLREWVRTHRAELIWAALTLGQAWIAAGRPEARPLLGMFEDYCNIMGGVLSVAGIPGFLGNLDEFYTASDAEGNAWRAFVASWADRYGTRDVGVVDLWKIVDPTDGADPIDLQLGDGTERSQKTRLGLRLADARMCRG